jgi:exodeoxyribonuclease VII large subunit
MLQRQHEMQKSTKLFLSKSTNNAFAVEKAALLKQTEKLSKQSQFQLTNSALQLKNIAQLIHILSPENVLKRGFSITLQNGKSLKGTNTLLKNEPITTILANGTILSNIISTTNNEENER